MTEQELQDIADTYGLYTEEDVKNRLSCELLGIGARNEELEKENAELKEEIEEKESNFRKFKADYQELCLLKDMRIDDKDKRIAELEEKISVLLSCKNCPENKGGYICEKEYENKCLTQKIQFIKELQEEIADLEAQIEKMKCCGNCGKWENCDKDEMFSQNICNNWGNK